MFARRLLVAVCLLVPAVALAADPAHPKFAAQVKESFAKWDADKNGTLSREEIDRAVDDPAVKGPEAAAIVALSRAARNTKFKLPPLTQNAIVDLAAVHGKDQPDFNAMYTAALDRIARANHDLFPKGVPNIDALHQGRLGDCFCLAPLGSMVCRDPKDVVKMIRKQSDGSYLVRLGTRDVPVPPITDAEIALTASTGADGVWVNVYEKAIGVVRLEKAKASGQTSASAVELLAKGGSAGTTVELVTGHSIERFSCKFAKDAAVNEKERTAKLGELRKHLTAAFTEKRLVTCGTAAGVTTPNVSSNHAYAVTGYDAASDEIALWNPHGQTFTPKGKHGLENGYPTKNGQFKMPLPEFVRTFAGVAFELPSKK